MNAEHLIGDEPFIYTYADDFIVASPSRFTQMIELYNRTGSSVLTCIRVTDDKDYERYGIVAGAEIEPGLLSMSTIVEKPGKEKAPSNLASVSGYLLTPDIFKSLHIAQEQRNDDAEFYIQPAIQQMISEGHQVLAYEVKGGHFYDTGNKLEYLKTIVDFALQRPDMHDEFLTYLKDIVGK